MYIQHDYITNNKITQTIFELINRKRGKKHATSTKPENPYAELFHITFKAQKKYQRGELDGWPTRLTTQMTLNT